MSLHANIGAVAIDGRAILIGGPSGSGKSSLALALIDRGAGLIADDGVALERRGEMLWAAAPHTTAGKIEVRNVGIVGMPVTGGPVALVIRLDADAPRHREEPESEIFEGVQIPSLTLFPDIATLPLRAEWALRQYGLETTQLGS